MAAATDRATLHIFQLKSAPVVGQPYTFELCADLPDRGCWYEIYSGDTLIESIHPEEFNADGIGRKSLHWKHGGVTQLSLCLVIPGNYTQDISITSIKLYIGDEYWDNAYNLISYNNVWNDSNHIWNDINRYTVTSKSTAGDRDIFEHKTSLYAYLEKDTDYMFSCKTDSNWGFKGYNYIANGKFEAMVEKVLGPAIGSLRYVTPVWWDFDNPRILSVFDKNQTSGYNRPGMIYLTNTSTGESGIYQETDAVEIPPNTEITISFDIDWELNVKDCEARLEYYDEDNKVIEEETVILNKLDGYVYSGNVETTLTTIDRYSYFIIHFVHGGIIDKEADADRLMLVGNVKLEKGSGASDNQESVDNVYMHLCNYNDEAQRVELANNPFRFTVPSSGIWTLYFDIMKNNTTHSFWDVKIAKSEILDEEELVSEGEEDIYEEEDDN